MALDAAVKQTMPFDERGEALFAQLPPGQYTVFISLPGLPPMAAGQVTIRPGEESRTSVSDPRIAAPWRSTRQLTIDREFSERLPGSGSNPSMVSVPGVLTNDGRLYVNGAAANDNQFARDGLNVTDPLTRLPAGAFISDAAWAQTILTTGLPAEYGDLMGGRVQTITLPPDDAFRATVRLRYVDPEWQADREHEINTPISDPIYQPTLTLQFPIVRGSLWLLASYGYREIEWPADEIGITGTETSYTQHFPYLKLSFLPNSAHVITASFSGEQADEEDRDYRYSSDAQALLETGSPAGSLTWTFAPQPRWRLETLVGSSRSYLNWIPESGSRSRAATTNEDTGMTEGNYSRWYEQSRELRQFSCSASFADAQWHGSHLLKAGFQAGQDEYTEGEWIPGDYHYFVDDHGNFTRRVSLLNPGEADFSRELFAVFLQDAWRISGQWTVNAGLRLDRAKFDNDAGSSLAQNRAGKDGGAKMEFGPCAAPRLGFIWDMAGDQTRLMRVSAGRYYNLFDLSLPLLFTSEDGQSLYLSERYRDGQWQEEYRDQPGLANRLDSGLKAEYTDELAVGYEQRLSEGIAVGTQAVYRRTGDLIEDAGLFLDGELTEVGSWQDDEDPSSEDYAFLGYYVTNPRGAVRDYRGIEVYAEIDIERLAVKASYRYSTAKGSVTETVQDGAGLAQFGLYYDTPSLSRHLYGELPWDSAHQAEINAVSQAVAAGPYQLWLGLQATYVSGFARSKLTRPPNADSPYSSYYCYLPEGRGTYRLPSVFLLNLSVQQDFAVGRAGALTLIFDVFNLLDNQVATDKDYTYREGRSEHFERELRWEDPRSYELSLKYTF